MADTIQDNFVQLEKRDSLRRELLANISHDLRGPVGVIRGTSEQMSNRLSEVSAPAVRSHLEELLSGMNRSVDSLATLLNDLFELAKLEAREIEYPKEPFLLEQLLTDLFTGYRARTEQFGVTLQRSGSETLPLVNGNINMLGRVLENLLDNAIRYTLSGGTITIDAVTTDSGVRIAVRDTGVGIPAEELPMVFERFVRGDRAISVRGESTGLGLAIVREIVEAHGSQIRVASELGVGTEFYFELAAAHELNSDYSD